MDLQAKWVEDLKLGFFDIEPFLSTTLQHLPDFADFFITSLRLDPLDHIPALPCCYASEFNEERVMYLFNVPRSLTRERLHEILDDFGVVERLPTVTDLVSRETFRWVIMSTKEEATRLYKMLRLVPVAECEHGNIIAVTPCRPGRGLVLDFHRQKHALEVRSIDDAVPIYGGPISTVENPLYDRKAAVRAGMRSTSSSSLDPNAAIFDLNTFQNRFPSSRIQSSTSSNPAFTDSFISSLESNPLAALIKSLIKKETSEDAHNQKQPSNLESSDSKTAKSAASKSAVAIPNIVPHRLSTPKVNTSMIYGTSHALKNSTKVEGAQIPSTAEVAKNDSLNGYVEKDVTIAHKSGSFGSASALGRTPVSSWAAVATAGTSTKVIDIASNSTVNPANRLRSIGRVPSGGNPSKTEPLADQMRVVFILDIPNTLNYDDISNAVREGPLRSIHFGIDEEKESRFAAIVFQHARDAAVFVNVLHKERLESRPERFKWVVDVARGEEPFPLDDVLRSMQGPTFATRRLTLVKASLFFMMGERRLKAKIEKIVGEGSIQLVWLYNGGNATVVFSDVTAAIAVKEEFDRYTATAGKPDGAPLAWAGLQTTFSKDPCVQPLDLKTAMYD